MRKIHAATIFLVLLLTACTISWQRPVGKNAKVLNSELTLEVALYSDVPDPDAFQQAVSKAWKQKHPDIGLRFTDWDCYSSDPDQKLDVFVFDAIYLSSFVAEGYLLPIPEEKIQNKEDLFPFALEGCRCDGKLYALPQLLCTDFLYTRKEDGELSGVSDIVTLYDILGDRKSRSVIPEKNEGLLIDLSDELLAKTIIYLEALMDEQQEYTDYRQLPSVTAPSELALTWLENIWKMGGNAQVSYCQDDNDAYVRARWFADGKGRAYIGYSEALNAMGDYADDVIVRRFSYGTGRDIPLFYSDVVGIRSDICEEKKGLAYELANLLISEEMSAEMCLPDGGTPQYLLPTRRSVYDAFCEDYPIYGYLKGIVDNSDNHVFRIGSPVREFINGMGAMLAEQIAQIVGCYELTDVHRVGGRQGICAEEGNYWVSGSGTLEKYDSNWNLIAENTTPFDGYALEVNHIGDIDVYNNELYLGVEYFMDGEGKNIQVAVYDGDTLKLKKIFPFHSDTDQMECSGIAIDPDSRTIYMTSWGDDEASKHLYMYDLDTGDYRGKLKMQPSPKWLQGIAYWGGSLYVTSDDGNADDNAPDHMYRVDISEHGETGLVTLEKTFDDVIRQGEIEGVTFDDDSGQLLLLYNRGAIITDGMPTDFYDGYSKEIHEVYVFDIVEHIDSGSQE